MEAPNEIDLDLKATQRKLNLLCSWIHLKFGQDPTFPQALLPSSSYDNDIEIKEEKGGRPLFEPIIMQAPLNVEENTTSEPIQHRCGICSAPFSSSQALTLHKTSHCSVKLTRIDNELHARKSARKCKLKARQFFSSDFKTWNSDEDNNETETILLDMDTDYEPPAEFVASPLVKQATTSEGSTCLVRINLKPSDEESNLSSKRTNTIKCQLCSEKFKTRPELFRHKYNVHSKRPQKKRTGIISICPECGIKLGSIRALMEHARNEHPGSDIKVERLGKITCLICEKIFYSRTNFKTHMRHIHKSEIPPELDKKITEMEKEFYMFRNSWCYKCEKGFERPTNLISHLKYEHPDQYLAETSVPATTTSFKKHIRACPYCPEKFTTRPAYFRHKFTVHADRIKKINRIGIVSTCPVCGIKLGSYKALELHVFNEHPESNVKLQRSINSRITCPFCKKLFLSLNKFKTHLRQVHNSEVPPEYKDRVDNDKEGHILRNSWCDKCEMGFERSTQLITHIKTVHPDEYKAKNPEYIPKTKRCKRSKSNEKSHSQCQECGISVKTRCLPNHMKIHGEKSLFCHLCTYATHKLGTLKRHLETHSEERKYKCKLCPYAAKQQTGVDLHIKNMHVEKERVQCELCGQFFKAKYHLQKHVKAVHQNKRPYPCNLCDKSFKVKTHLNYHLRTHSNPNGRKRGLNKEREPIVRRPPTAKRTFYTAVNMEQLPQSGITCTTTAEDKDIDILGKGEPGQDEGAIRNMSSFIAHNQTQAQSTTSPECSNFFSMPWYGHR